MDNNFQPEGQPKQSSYKTKLLLAVTTVAVLIGGYFLMTLRYCWWPTKCTSPLITLTSNISDWQTYRNEEYGFEFRYPNTMEVKQIDVGLTPVRAFILQYPVKTNPLERNYSNIGVYPEGDSAKVVLKGKPNGVSEEILVFGVPVYSVSWGNEYGRTIIYNFIEQNFAKNSPKGNKIPSNWTECTSELKNCAKIQIDTTSNADLVLMNQILSTFKFIEPTSKINPQSTVLEKQIRIAVEKVLVEGKLANPNVQMPKGIKLLFVQLVGQNKIVLDFSKEIISGGQGVMEDVLSLVFNALDQYKVNEFYIQVEGKPIP